LRLRGRLWRRRLRLRRPNDKEAGVGSARRSEESDSASLRRRSRTKQIETDCIIITILNRSGYERGAIGGGGGSGRRRGWGGEEGVEVSQRVVGGAVTFTE